MLAAHASTWSASGKLAPIHCHRCALSNQTGTATLYDGEDQNHNCGLGSLVGGSDRHRKFEVQTAQLDEVVGAADHVGLVKIDVEGAELSVLRGAGRLLRERRIRDIVFEDQEAFPSVTAQFLQEVGYTVLSLGVRFNGPWVAPAGDGPAPMRPWDSQNFIATINPQRAMERLGQRGWKTLKG